MPPLLASAARLLADRSVRLWLAVAAALVWDLIVLSRSGDVRLAAVSVPLAVALMIWRTRPLPSILLAATTMAGLVCREVLDRDAYTNPGWFLVVVLPVLGGAMSPRRTDRTAGAVLAVAATVLATTRTIAQVGLENAPSSVQPTLVLSSALIFGLPFAATAALRRPGVRPAVESFVRERVAAVDLRDRATRALAVAAVALYTGALLLDVPFGQFATIVTVLPLAAALVLVRSRLDAAMLTAGLGLLLSALLGWFGDAYGPGGALAMLAAAVPLIAAAMDERIAIRRAAAAGVAGAALLFGLTTGSAWVTVLLLLVGGAPLGLAWIVRQRRTTGRLRIRLRESERRGRVAERGVQVEQERNRIAREVHDVVAHSLAVVIAQADGARFAAEAKPTSVGPALEAIADTARTALGEVRTMLHDLRTVGPDSTAPGPEDIASVIATVRTLGVEVRESVYGEPCRMTHDAGLALFRVAQEALTNAIRHGERDLPIVVEIDWGEQQVVLAVTNGVPATATPATERPGHGIPGMRERAALVGGEATAGRGTDGRFRVRVSLPVLPAATGTAVDDAIAELFAAGTRAS